MKYAFSVGKTSLATLAAHAPLSGPGATAKAGIAAMTDPTVSNIMMRFIGIILSCRGREDYSSPASIS